MALASAAAELLGAAGRFHDLLEAEGGGAAPSAAAFVGDRFEVHVRTLQGQLLVTVNQTLAAAAEPPPQDEPAPVGFLSEPNLLTESQVLAILAASLFVCALLHFLVPVPTKVKLAGPRLTYWRRVVRAQLYYLAAGIAGPIMLWQYQSKEELLYRFTRRHQVAFAVAIAHWVVATVEDVKTQGLLAQGMERVRAIGDQGKGIIFNGYMFHHAATIGIFVFCLWSHYLSSLCVLGFCFEIPVFFMNIREFLYTFRDTWRTGKLDKGYVNNLWTVIFVLFVLSRGGSHALYFHSVMYWKPMLATLPTKVWYLYHVVSIFFLVLNYLILNVLSIWYRLDLEADAPAEKAQPVRVAASNGEAPVKNGRAAPSASHCPIGPASAPAVHDMENPMPASAASRCPMGHGAAATDSPVAGGDEPKSGAAKMQARMEAKKAKFAAAAKEDELCRKWKMSRGYRMGSFYGGANGETVQIILDNFSYVAGMSLAAYWASTLSLGIGGSSWDAEARSLFALVVIIVAGGLGAATALRLKRLPKVLSRCLSPAVHLGSLCLVALLVSCACCWQSPGISLVPGVAIALVITELVQSPLAFGPDHLLLLGISFWVFDWAWPSITFGFSLAGCFHGIARGKGDSVIVSKVAIIMTAAAYSAVGLLFYWRSIARFGSLTVGLLQRVSIPPHFHCLLALPVAVHMFLTWFDGVVTLSWLLNAAMVTRTVCYVTMLWHLGDFWVMAGWLVHMRRMMMETRRELKEPGAAPNVMIAVEQIDVIRSTALSFLWRVIAQLLSVLFNMWLLPSDVMVYVFPAPFPRIVSGMSCGVCVSVDGPRDMKPGAFVCNVGHIDTDCEDWQDDLQRTARSSIGILREFEKHPDKEELGLVTNILCFLPVDRSAKEPGAQEFFKEFNFSAWKSEKHAYDWYVRSPDHKEVMTEHTNGILKRFGNVLTSLKPTREIRWQGRCSDPKCASLVEGYPEVRECECGAPVIDMPLF